MRKIPACREIIRLSSLKYSDKRICELTGAARQTIKRIREKAEADGICWPLDDMMDDERIYYMLFPAKTVKRSKKQPDYEALHIETLQGDCKKNLYDKYLSQCDDEKAPAIGYVHFCRGIQNVIDCNRISEDKKLQPGKKAVVFWLDYFFSFSNGKLSKAYIFFGMLPYSQRVFVRAYKDRGIKTWIDANTNMLEYFGGVPEEIEVSGLKNGFAKGNVDAKYKELIDYYGLIVTVQSKNAGYVEEVQDVAGWFVDNMEKLECVSIEDLNLKLDRLMELFHSIKCNGKSKQQSFSEDESICLRTLPEDRFVSTVRKPATIWRNCHVSYEKRFYSVPYQYLLEGKKSIELEVSSKSVKVYYNNILIAEHPNLKDEYPGTYSTVLSHMPSDEEELALDWNRESFLKRAERAGNNTRRIIDGVMRSKMIRQQTYRTCDLILRLGTTYTYSKLEAACQKIKVVRNGSVYKRIEDELKKYKD